MKTCLITTTYSPPYSNPTGIPFPYPPTSGYCFAVYYEDTGRKRVCGSSNSPYKEKAVQRALSAAKRAGFTHYRLEGTEEVCALASE